MISRTRDKTVVENALKTYSDEIKGLILEDWLLRDNIAFVNDSGDVALFERQYKLPSTVCGHYFFFSRGRKAIDTAQEMLGEIFSGDYDVTTVVGLTPVAHKAALWMNRKLGFKDYGEVDTETGLHLFVMLTKQDWLKQKEVENE